jgi:GNAT superfamily N-acetyltransferase
MTDGDLPFVAGLYASTRQQEVSLSGWSPAQQRDFLLQQHGAQHRHYRATYEGADWLIIESGGKAIGRLYRIAWPREIRIIDISLVPEARGLGIGAAIIRGIQDEAAKAGKGVSIHVEKQNPARSLYLQLGFIVSQDKGVYDLMEWQPETGRAS